MQRNIFNTLTLIVGIFIFSALPQVAYADTCEVTKIGSGLQGSLDVALWEHAQADGFCRDKIEIQTDVYIDAQMTVDDTNNDSLVIEGDKSEEDGYRKFYSKITQNSTPLFDLTSSHNLTIKNMALRNYSDDSANTSSPLLKCDGSSNLQLENVLIANNPTEAMVFDSCGDLTITNLVIDADSDVTNYTSDTVDPSVPYIQILNSNNVHIVSLTIKATKKAIDRDAISIDGGTNLKIDYLKVEQADNENATVLKIANVTDLESLGVDLQQVAGSGIKLENITNNTEKSYTLTQVSGTYTGSPTVSGTAAEYETTSLGDGVVVSGSSSKMNFTLGGVITNFKRSGFVIAESASVDDGAPANIAISGGQIANNGGFGVVISDTVDEASASVSNLLVKDNGNCGVAIGSAQVVDGVNYVGNGNSCSLGVPDSLKLATSEILLVATDDEVATLDVSNSLKTDTNSYSVELHRYYASTTTTSSSGTGSGRPGDGSGKLEPGEGVARFAELAAAGPLQFDPSVLQGGSSTATSSTGVQPMTAATDEDQSNVGTSATADYSIGSMPHTDVPLSTSNDTFMAIVQNDDGIVTGVWYGDTNSIGEGECLYTFADGECGCIQGATTYEYIKVYRIAEDTDGDGVIDVGDTDGDGIFDNEEKGGLGGYGDKTCAEGSCQTDGYEGDECTSPILSDTDADEMLDNNEITYGTNPLDIDTDDDNLIDGKEDICESETSAKGRFDADCETDALNNDTDGDGILDGIEINGDQYDPLFETNPMLPDTDGDGVNEGAEDNAARDPHPLCNDNTKVCSYSDCRDVESINEAVDGSFTISESEANASADDDGDLISNLIEDSGSDATLTYNCNYEASNGETDPLNPDSDADGCKDGEEDRNYDGVKDDGETDPRTSDTDGDGILDGTEVAGCVYVAGNTTDSDPTLTDTDGDGINDGIEDLNFNGTLDAGETNPALSDTDNDGLYDTAWPVAIVVNDDGSVSPAEEGRDLSPNYNDSTNVIINYYCGVSNYDYKDTDGDTIADAVETPTCRLDPSNVSSASSLKADTDDDGLPDDLEFCYGTSPWAVDTDGDAHLGTAEITDEVLANSLTDYNEASASGRISIETMRATCADGVLESEGATPPLMTTTSCSLNGNLLATSGGHYPITVVMLMLASLVGLRGRQVLKA